MWTSHEENSPPTEYMTENHQHAILDIKNLTIEVIRGFSGPPIRKPLCFRRYRVQSHR